jgi:hypothetical protein
VITRNHEEQHRGAPEDQQNERKNRMVNDPLIRYELVKAQQRERWQEAELARQARAAPPHPPGRVERMEAALDLTGLVKWVIQNVWKRVGLPAREGGSRPLPAPPPAILAQRRDVMR